MSQPEVVELKIEDLSRAGTGVAREASGRVVFVPLTVPGDVVRARIVEAKKRYAQGALVEVVTPSPIRVVPPCPAFGKCGGCQLQHLPYAEQWKLKFKGVQHSLSRVQVDLPAKFEELPAEQIWEYRNRVQLRGFKDVLGFYAAGSHDVIPLSRCEIARPEINAAWPSIREEGSRLSKPYKVEVEVLPDGTLRKTWNQGHAASGFRQVHDTQNEKLKAWVGAALTPGRELLDLYGGSGNLSLPLASKMTRVQCVDLGAPSGQPVGTPENFSYHRSEIVPWLLRNRGGADARPKSAILDPPREGLGADFAEILAALEKMKVDQLVLVGCDPDAWARDVSRFVRRNWKFHSGAVLDLFPQTHHVESIALLLL